MQIKGLITAMVTPFDDNENIDLQATKKLINHLISNGVSGIFILGTNGEFHVISKEDKLFFTREVIKIVNKRVPVFVGTGGNSTEEVIDLTNEVAKLGADAVSIITPYLLPLTEDELYFHYEIISKNCQIPIILYNIPKNTGNPLSPNLVARLAKLPNIIGIKDSSGDIKNIKNYIEVTKNEDFSVVSGSDSLILEALKLGATGAVAATSNVIVKTDRAIIDCFNRREYDKAEQFQENVNIFRQVQRLSTIPSVLKYALAIIGIPVGKPKRPVLFVNDQDKKEIRKAMLIYKDLEKDL